MPAIQAAREAARRSQCLNNLKQIGIAIHNFHDSLKGIPPLTVGNSAGNNWDNGAASQVDTNTNHHGVTMFALIYPFIEQMPLYEQLYSPPAGSAPATISPVLRPLTLSPWAWRLIDQKDPGWTKNFGSVATYQCPTRRGGGVVNTPIPDNWTNTNEGNFLGPQGDYAMVIAAPDVNYWFRNTSPTQVTNYAVDGPLPHAAGTSPGPDLQRGPFRVADAQDTNASDANVRQRYLSRDTFARISDGLSNQLMVGEKQIHPDNIGLCDNTGKSHYIAGDCTYMTTGTHRTGGVRAMVKYSGSGTVVTYQPLSSPTQLAATQSASLQNLAFGSWHPGLCNFVLGDGSVRSFPITTHNTRVLGPLSIVDDGALVAMPE